MYGSDVLAIKKEIDIPKTYGVRYNNGDHIWCDIIKETEEGFLIEANGVGCTGVQRVLVRKNDVVALSRKGSEWENLTA
ncbi:hypothetical protein P4H71_05230 [Paenibacillus kribbensis]|uniref:hypothetical protein n=1 Tax=Paenibacillus kribbensis TaxID=172713 RepID=UPI002DB664EA|nr:hypothetical protein [Paenibacillus kribbensis]MEC0233758.1 hypothetical protein [Paenibacillus kribbensis]